MHNEHNPHSGTISRLQGINNFMPGDTPRKILISGTPFEMTLAHMAGWIGVIENDKNDKPPSVRPDYSRMNNHWRDLVHCTSKALIALGKEHARLDEALLRITARTRSARSIGRTWQPLFEGSEYGA